jgi:hypothetical protein
MVVSRSLMNILSADGACISVLEVLISAVGMEDVSTSSQCHNLCLLALVHLVADIAILGALIVIINCFLVSEESHEGQELQVFLSEGIHTEAGPEELAIEEHLHEPEDISIENCCQE